ncbi:MAG: DUF1080 domain-containing protein [Bacteroidales bacterium]|nr:DUF1080 domain-containing protein [Bacteroidales bacterium]
MNIRYFLAALCAAAIFVSCSDEKIETLFNGENLEGWKTVVADEPEGTEEDTFSAREGVMHITGKPFGYIRTEKKYSDYLLHLEWRWAGEESVDGGVFNYLQDGDKVWPLGVQLQMTSKDMGLLMGGIKIEGVDGPFYRKNRLVEESPEKPVGEWNEMEFLCLGGKIKVWLNGVLVNEAVCDATDGYIAIQSEGGAMDFRNIQIDYSKRTLQTER